MRCRRVRLAPVGDIVKVTKLGLVVGGDGPVVLGWRQARLLPSEFFVKVAHVLGRFL